MDTQQTDSKHNEHYYEKGRNGWTPNSTWQDEVVEDKDNKWSGGEIDTDSRVPEYYKGKEGYEARKVCDNFDLPYHLATATTYILRAYRKHDTPVECLTKAIAHLEFELEKITRDERNSKQ